MIAMALTQLGDVARRQGRYSTALRLLASTERHAASASTLTQVLRCETLARAHAETGDRGSFERAIDQAEQLAERISPEHHREGKHSPRGVRLERGQGLTLLGDPAAALAIYAEAAPPAFRPDRERGSFAIIEAQALAHAGHLDEGVRRAIEGLDLARSYGSPRHISRVQRMHDRLARTTPATDPRMVELRDALAA
jgi:tetratricopeptide (TPR) repeat protein